MFPNVADDANFAVADDANDFANSNIEVLYIIGDGLSYPICQHIIKQLKQLKILKIRTSNNDFSQLSNLLLGNLLLGNELLSKSIEIYDHNTSFEYILSLLNTSSTKLKIHITDLGNSPFIQTIISFNLFQQEEIQMKFVLQKAISVTQLQQIFLKCINLTEYHIKENYDDSGIYDIMNNHYILPPKLEIFIMEEFNSTIIQYIANTAINIKKIYINYIYIFDLDEFQQICTVYSDIEFITTL